MTQNNNRQSASQRRAMKTSNPYMITSASQRRTTQRAQSGKGTSAEAIKNKDIDMATIQRMLANPTIEVTTEQLKQEYGYVLRDIRSMFVVAAGLITLLVALALILPR
jgi:hypothetical protein